MSSGGAFSLQAAEFGEVPRGAALEVALVAVKAVEGFGGGLVEEGCRARGGVEVLSFDDLADVLAAPAPHPAAGNRQYLERALGCLSDGQRTVAFSSDTSETQEFWNIINRLPSLEALLIEASFPNSMAELAEVSRHFTPASLQRELGKLNHKGVDILAVHIKPAYRKVIIDELNGLNVPGLRVMEPGRNYDW